MDPRDAQRGAKWSPMTPIRSQNGNPNDPTWRCLQTNTHSQTNLPLNHKPENRHSETIHGTQTQTKTQHTDTDTDRDTSTDTDTDWARRTALSD